MRICHVVPSLQQEHGGPSKSVRALCLALARAGNSVELFATAPGAPAAGIEETDSTLRTSRYLREWPQKFSPSSGLRKALATTQADVIHHHALWLRTLHYAKNTALRSRIPLVVSPRGMMSRWAWNHHRWRKRFAASLIHPGAFAAVSGWHVTSVEEEREIRELGFSQPICVAPNGVDAPTTDDLTIAAQHWRTACPEVTTRRTALFYGRFHEKKRVIELIDLWLERTPADWLLLLVGIPEDYTPAMLEDYALRMSGAGRIRAFAGTGRPPPYPVGQLFLLPSHNENFGLAVAEAMAHGTPALVTDTTPWRDLNTDERGWCVPWDSYGVALEKATHESAEALRYRGERARTWVLREYSWHRAARSLVEFYSRLQQQAHA